MLLCLLLLLLLLLVLKKIHHLIVHHTQPFHFASNALLLRLFVRAIGLIPQTGPLLLKVCHVLPQSLNGGCCVPCQLDWPVFKLSSFIPSDLTWII